MKIYPLLLLLFLASCASFHQDNETVYSSFPREKQLYAQTLEVDTALFRYPFRVRIEGDKAIVLDLHGADHYCHVFQYPEFMYLSSFGKRGDSPEEMLSIENVRYGTDGSVWILDSNKGELDRFVFSSSGDSLLLNEIVSLDKSLLRALDFAQLDESTFVVPDYSGETRFCKINQRGRVVGKGGAIPTTNDEAYAKARPALAQAWRSFVDYNPGNGVLAAVTQLGEVLEIYNLKDSTHVVRIGPNGEPEFQIADGYGVPTGIMGFSDVKVTDRAIYAVFHGRTFKEIAQQKETSVDGGQYIYVFSLEGEPICKYTLDRYVNGIHVDEEKQLITATDVNNDQPIIQFSFD